MASWRHGVDFNLYQLKNNGNWTFSQEFGHMFIDQNKKK